VPKTAGVDDFVESANGMLEEQQDCDAEAQTALPEKRTKKEEKQVSWQKTSPLPMQTWIKKIKICKCSAVCRCLLHEFKAFS
jgi:hypothetical protein